MRGVKMIRKITRLLWKPNFMIGQFLGILAIILTPIWLVMAIYYPIRNVILVLCMLTLLLVGMAIHHMELFREILK